MARKRKAKGAAVSKQLPLEGSFPEHLYEIARDLSRRYDYVEEIAKGKTAVTYKLSSRTNPNHFLCLKTVRPDISEGEVREKVRHTLANEVQILLPLSHRGLPTIIEHNTTGRLPYYVCSYHPGCTFGEFKRRHHTLSFQQSVFAIWSLMDVLKTLHKAGRTHCDLHQENVMISQDVFKDGLLVIDFGSGHRDSDSSPDTSNRGNVNFKDIDGQHHAGFQVKRDDARAGFAYSDFNALGRLLAIMQESFFSDASSSARAAYDDFCQSLQAGHLNDWGKVQDRFLSVLDPYRIISSNADLFLSARGTPQQVVIPVSRGVPVGDAPLSVINTQVFQRLRNVRQLSFCDWFFPGATHSRFEHSIGTFGVAKQVLDALVHDRQFRDIHSPEQIKAFFLAALLHDVGHYPFAHAVEQYAASRFPNDVRAKDIVSHERHAIELLECDTELSAIVEKKWGAPTREQAIAILERKAFALSDLIDGPIDIDKMDYLMRDAVHCGIAFGDGLDVRSLVKALRVVNNGNNLGIEENGLSATEGLMVLQDQMLSSVYWHERVRGVICMFHAILAHLVKRDLGLLESLVKALKNAKGDNDALLNVLLPMARNYREPERDHLIRLVELFLYPRFPELYVPIRTYRRSDPPQLVRFNIYQVIVAEQSSQSVLPINWRWVGALRDAFLHAFEEKGITAEPLQLVVDAPYGKNSRRMVYVQTHHGKGEMPITEVSHLNKSIFEQPAAFLSPIRVYVAPELYDKARNQLQSIVASAEEWFKNERGVAEEASAL